MNKNSFFAVITFLILEIILLLTLWNIIQSHQWQKLGLVALAIGTLILPFILTWLANHLRIQLPPGFQLLTLIFLFLTQYLGEIKGFYQSLWWWDLFLHGAFGIYGVVIAFYILKPHLEKREGITDKKYSILLSIFAFSFSVTSSALWELFEFVGDLLLPVKMVKGGLEDTMTDLILGAIGAALTSLIYYFRWGKRNY